MPTAVHYFLSNAAYVLEEVIRLVYLIGRIRGIHAMAAASTLVKAKQQCEYVDSPCSSPTKTKMSGKSKHR